MKHLIESFTIGTDPEGWIISKKTGQSLPIIGLLGGKKNEPVEFLPGFGYQEDNCSWEFNIPPCNNEKEFQEAIQTALAELENVLENFILVIQPAMEFHPSLLNKREAIEIGCSEDLDCYTWDVAPIPDLAETNERYAGGHIHIGYDNPTWLNQVLLAKYMDLYLGVPSILLDGDTTRKAIYGTAGRIRMKPYGIEYRTLSNFWISDPKYISFVYKQVEKAIAAYNQFQDTIDQSSERIANCINTQDVEEAKKLIEEYNIYDIDSLPVFIPQETNKYVLV